MPQFIKALKYILIYLIIIQIICFKINITYLKSLQDYIKKLC